MSNQIFNPLDMWRETEVQYSVQCKQTTTVHCVCTLKDPVQTYKYYLTRGKYTTKCTQCTFYVLKNLDSSLHCTLYTFRLLFRKWLIYKFLGCTSFLCIDIR